MNGSNEISLGSGGSVNWRRFGKEGLADPCRRSPETYQRTASIANNEVVVKGHKVRAEEADGAPLPAEPIPRGGGGIAAGSYRAKRQGLNTNTNGKLPVSPPSQE